MPPEIFQTSVGRINRDANQWVVLAVLTQHVPCDDVIGEKLEQLTQSESSLFELGYELRCASNELTMHSRVRVEAVKTQRGKYGFLVLEMHDDPGDENIDAGRKLRNRFALQHCREQRVGVQKQFLVLSIDYLVAASVVWAPNQLDESGLFARFDGIGH